MPRVELENSGSVRGSVASPNPLRIETPQRIPFSLAVAWPATIVSARTSQADRSDPAKMFYLRTANLSFADDDRGLSRFSSAEGRITSSAIET